MIVVGLRSTRKEVERKERKTHFIKKTKNKMIDNYEEFKLNRDGKTKRRRADVKSRYRRLDKNLTALIIILTLLLAITWIVVLFY